MLSNYVSVNTVYFTISISLLKEIYEISLAALIYIILSSGISMVYVETDDDCV